MQGISQPSTSITVKIRPQLNAPANYDQELKNWAGNDPDRLRVAAQIRDQGGDKATVLRLNDVDLYTLKADGGPPVPPKVNTLILGFSDTNPAAIEDAVSGLLGEVLRHIPETRPLNILLSFHNSMSERDIEQLLHNIVSGVLEQKPNQIRLEVFEEHTVGSSQSEHGGPANVDTTMQSDAEETAAMAELSQLIHNFAAMLQYFQSLSRFPVTPRADHHNRSSSQPQSRVGANDPYREQLARALSSSFAESRPISETLETTYAQQGGVKESFVSARPTDKLTHDINTTLQKHLPKLTHANGAILTTGETIRGITCPITLDDFEAPQAQTPTPGQAIPRETEWVLYKQGKDSQGKSIYTLMQAEAAKDMLKAGSPHTVTRTPITEQDFVRGEAMLLKLNQIKTETEPSNGTSQT
ncbi:hypothetical protein AAKU58_003285 [Oxalobacteraceae bacterium GrIS 1.18]